MIRLFRIVLPLCALALALSACAGDKKKKVEVEQPVGTLYNRAADEMDQGNYKSASKDFDEVERQHPYSEWATKAQLMSAYSLYKAEQYDDAAEALNSFTELHPGSPDVDYALYLKALCYYEQISDVTRDQELTHKALDALNALTLKYPNSRYARDAALKRDLTQDHLAGKEMEIGRYYQNRRELNAALNRYGVVVRNYQTTTHVPEALHRMVECYMTLGLKDQALRVAAVLGYNYPGSKWYAASYKLLDDRQRAKLVSDRSFKDRTIDSLFKPD